MAQSAVRSPKDDLQRLRGPTVKIMVGASKKPFHVHESIICTSSLFFKMAMSGPWKESEEHTIELPEDDPITFAVYSHWLYYAKIPVIVEDAANEKPSQVSAQEYNDLAKAYVLGDKLLDVKFQNYAIDAIIERRFTPDAKTGKCYLPNRQSINYTYDNTTESATIRKLFVDMYVGNMTPGWLSRELPKDFLFLLLRAVIEKTFVLSENIKASDYYVHSSTEEKGLKRKLEADP
ncbi:hypothetical protein N7463_001931 [Penicillium fimorum]|uniref:BTB domain-containing protein n=1 Tax=Penicillium fimorum TaxID=1882269 RepID=A0A9W9XY41_9EURO|nr:hypothetical protein N7463_001931 [Penicillium fimorum]